MNTKQRLLLSTTALAGTILLATAASAQTPTPTQSTLPPNTQAEAESEAQDAQDSVSPADSDAVEVGEVIVTGSRIPRPQFEGVIPGSQVEQAEIERRSFTNALDVLNDVPLVGFGTALNTNGGQPSSLGVGFVDLLDLGTQRTLTLVNGRRFVSGNAASLFVADNATGSQVDVTTIPVSLIDRVDVLTVGGAAAYGSDAIAGVVNYILRDDFEGTEASVVGGISSRSDAGNFSLRGLVGRNFLDDRLNLTASYEYNYIDSLTGAEREFRAERPNSVTNFAQGSARNSAFNRNALATGSNTAFLPGASDQIPGTVFLPNTRSLVQSPGGVIFQATANQTAATVPGNSNGPVTSPLLATNTQLVLGVPLTAGNTVGVPNAAAGNPFNASGNPISTFAPTALPTGVTPAQVFAAFGATPPAGSTAAQQTALAVAILQANRPTPREYLAANPNTPLNAFLGTFIAPFPDVANTDPATNRFLPRVAVPLRFDQNGNIETFTAARLDNPGTPGQLDRAPNSEGYDDTRYTIIRVEQKRNLANFFGRFTINDNIEFFTENLFADVRARAPFNLGGLTNAASGSTVENAPLVVNVNNPFLDAGDRATLASVGITQGNFVLGRTNEDILGDNPSKVETQTLRSSNGFRGDFDLLNRKFNYEASATYGKVEAEVTQGALLDVEYALALDAVRDPATGNIVCRAKLNPGAFLGTSPTGVFANVIRPLGADGIRQEQIFTPTVTQAQIDACQPLNPFGVNQMTQAAKDYVRTQNVYMNTSEQVFLQAFVSSTLFELPGGPLDYSLAAEYREDQLEFTTNPINQAGRTRSAPSAQTEGKTETVEYGIELRIPIFGEDFNFPLLRSLEINPAVRWSQQDGAAPAYRSLAGQLVNQDSEGDRERIEQLAVTYRPLEDLLLRGNVTSSIRQPSVTELFLGGQPSFINAFTDPCSQANINSGPVPATRRRNCEAAAARANFAGLANFTPTGASVQGVFAGSTSLSAEKADSWTAGFVYEPRFIPGLQASLDYIVVDLQDQIVPTNLTQALQFCYDSPTEGDTTAQFGANTCAFFSRDPTFNVQSGFTSGFLNLSSTQVKAWNAAVNYEFDIADLVSRIRPTEADLGEIDFRFSGFHLVKFATSAAGDFSDTQRSEGDIVAGRPEYETQFRTLYTRGPFDLSYTVNYASSTRIFTGGVPNTVEQTSIIEIEPSLVQNVTVGYEFDERIRAQLTVDNITDETTYGSEGFLAGPGFTGYIDQIGRRFTASVRAKF